jgi:excisionase family DNA binding protein
MRLTIKEAAEYLRLSRGHLGNMRTEGDGPRFYKLGRKILYEQSDLDVWLALHRRRSTSDKANFRRARRRSNKTIDVSR